MKSFLKIIIIFIFFILSFSSNSKTINNSDKLIIEADTSIEYFEDKKIYIATGNAIATKGNFILKAKNIKAFMMKNSSDQKVKKIIAKGNVIIKKDQEIAKSDIADYDFDSKIILLNGKYQSFKNSKLKIESTGFIKFDDFNKKAYSRENVKLYLQNSTKIFSNELKALFKKDDDSIIYAEALGNVKIITKLETIICNSAKFENKDGVVTLIGGVKIKKGNSIIIGEKGVINLNSGKSKIFSNKSKRIKGVFSPTK